MNREILFRGKCLRDNKWVEGDYTRYSMEHGYITVDLIEQPAYQVHTKTVGQYTGLTDKNGRKIFEGDILHGFMPDYTVEPERVGVVKWGDWGWLVCFNKPEWKVPRVGLGCFSGEIIGNIHDNPELLERAADGADQDVLMPAT